MQRGRGGRLVVAFSQMEWEELEKGEFWGRDKKETRVWME
jgi:hypothetical protein